MVRAASAVCKNPGVVAVGGVGVTGDDGGVLAAVAVGLSVVSIGRTASPVLGVTRGPPARASAAVRESAVVTAKAGRVVAGLALSTPEYTFLDELTSPKHGCP